MKRFACLLAVLGVVCALAGCNTLGRQPQLQNAAMTPAQLKPGDSAVISVQVKDKHNIIRKIEGAVREDPNIKFKLHDDGTPPDLKGKDRLWSLQVDVPFQAPQGNYVLDLNAYRDDGTPVPIRTKEKKTVPLTASIPVIIRNP